MSIAIIPSSRKSYIVPADCSRVAVDTDTCVWYRDFLFVPITRTEALMELKVFTGRSDPALAEAIGAALSRLLDRPIEVPTIAKPFNDGEPNVQIPANVRGADVFLIQSTHQPGDHLVELFAMIDAAMRASAGSITAVMPYFGFARQDKKVRPRVPITAAMVCKLLRAAGAHRVLTTDLHAGQIQGFFDGPFDNLEALPVLLAAIRADLGVQFPDVAFVSPDDGGVERCRETGKIVHCERVTFVVKGRDTDGRLLKEMLVRDEHLVRDLVVFLIDDIVDSAGTLCGAAEALVRARARTIVAACVHPVLSTDRKTGARAIDRIAASSIERLYVTDSIPLRESHEKVRVVSIADLLARAIVEIHRSGSVSVIFEETAREASER